MGRRNIHKAARPANYNRALREAVERGGSLRDIQRAVREARLPQDRDEVRRLADECITCGGQGHKHTQCPSVKCFECGEFGHMKRHCPRRAK